MTRTALIGLLLIIFAAPVAADEPAVACEEAMTVFHDVSRIGRKDRAAANMTRRHADMAEEGWRFADSEPYIENSDLEGLFITYVRSVPCPGGDDPPDN
ncbi:MAG: hypothetical protein HKN58_04090 [Xanthomonadales bacterium]|nr:hypothetical protein [Xanthomonadales bacterium]